MVNVCARYNGTIISLKECNTEEEAFEFMKHDYILHYADEFENQEEDEIIYKDEMFIGDEIPFSEPIEERYEFEDDLPF